MTYDEAYDSAKDFVLKGVKRVFIFRYSDPGRVQYAWSEDPATCTREVLIGEIWNRKE